MKQKIREAWQSFTIKEKIGIFTGVEFLIILLSILFDIWVLKFSLIDFNGILQSNAVSSELVQAVEREREVFYQYIRDPEHTPYDLLNEAMGETRRAAEELPSDYSRLGELRYAETGSFQNLYEVYCQERDRLLAMEEHSPDYISRLYEVYDMQNYLHKYAQTLMTDTLMDGNRIYRQKVMALVCVPFLVIVAGALLFFGSVNLAVVMNHAIIHPIMQMVEAAQKIAENEFFVEDVKVENRDEIGELAHAFNKMKYATGEYILALEERRETYDLLHEEEMKKLETEKRLELMQFELLKNQMNPHFLFNTLNVIGGMANLEEAETTEKMIRSLSALLRYNLRTTEVEVPLEQELKVVRDYMYLQQMRFGSRISYEIACGADLQMMFVPSFTFQPLVENAIIHGLSPKEEGGKIRIRIYQGTGKLKINIGDNGVGMDEAALSRLRERLLRGSADQSGIGLGNISERIRTMYPEGGIEIYSKKNAGTVVHIEIPLENAAEWGGGKAYV